MRIYLACGTMGSVAGLVLGPVSGRQRRHGGRRADPAQERVSAPAVVALGEAAHEQMQQRDASVPSCPDLLSRLSFAAVFWVPATRRPRPKALEAMQLADELAGLKVETTYTAKALACLIADARSGRLAGMHAGVLADLELAAETAGARTQVDVAALAGRLCGNTCRSGFSRDSVILRGERSRLKALLARPRATCLKSMPSERSLRYRCVRSMPTRLASCPTRPPQSASCWLR